MTHLVRISDKSHKKCWDQEGHCLFQKTVKEKEMNKGE